MSCVSLSKEDAERLWGAAKQQKADRRAAGVGGGGEAGGGERFC